VNHLEEQQLLEIVHLDTTVQQVALSASKIFALQDLNAQEDQQALFHVMILTTKILRDREYARFVGQDTNAHQQLELFVDQTSLPSVIIAQTMLMPGCLVQMESSQISLELKQLQTVLIAHQGFIVQTQLPCQK